MGRLLTSQTARAATPPRLASTRRPVSVLLLPAPILLRTRVVLVIMSLASTALLLSARTVPFHCRTQFHIHQLVVLAQMALSQSTACNPTSTISLFSSVFTRSGLSWISSTTSSLLSPRRSLLLQDLLPAIDSSSSLWLIKSPDTPPCYPTCLVAPVEQLLSARTTIRSPLFTRHSTSPRS